VRRIIDAAQNKAIALLRENEPALREVARTLQEHEVVSGAEIKRIARVLQLTPPRDDGAGAEPPDAGVKRGDSPFAGPHDPDARQDGAEDS